MRDTQLDYLQARARQEHTIANTSKDNCVALAHLRMAEEYERRVQVLMDASRSDSAT